MINEWMRWDDEAWCWGMMMVAMMITRVGHCDMSGGWMAWRDNTCTVIHQECRAQIGDSGLVVYFLFCANFVLIMSLARPIHSIFEVQDSLFQDSIHQHALKSAVRSSKYCWHRNRGMQFSCLNLAGVVGFNSVTVEVLIDPRSKFRGMQLLSIVLNSKQHHSYRIFSVN